MTNAYHCTLILLLLPSTLLAADQTVFLKSHCIKCHGPDKQSGDRRFDKLTSDIQTPDDALLWQEILDQLNLGEMPPKKEKQPQKAELLAAIDAITQSLADATQRFKGTGSHTVLRRLNSFEYQQTIGDLLGLKFMHGRRRRAGNRVCPRCEILALHQRPVLRRAEE